MTMTMTADRPCLDCGEPITIARARHGNGVDREGYYRLHAHHQVRCIACTRRIARAHLGRPRTKALLDSLYRHGLRGVMGR